MNILTLTESDVEQLLDMPTTIEVVEEAFRRLAAGEADNVPRARCKAPGIVLHSMSAAAGYLGFVGWKQYTTTKEGAKFVVGLHSQESGELVALIEADRLGQMRTGAVSAVAVKFLTDAKVDRVGLFGAGWQAESQLRAVAAVRPIRQAIVYSRKPESRSSFAKRLSAELAIEVVAADEPRQAAADMPIVITATTSKTPVFDGNWLENKTLVCAMGSNWLEKAEIDVTTVRRATMIVCDSVLACGREAGDFVPAIEQGIFNWSTAIELSHVVAGTVPTGTGAAGITLFKSVGMAIEDLAVGARLLKLAKEKNIGSIVNLFS